MEIKFERASNCMFFNQYSKEGFILDMGRDRSLP